jgi:O-antigen ligase
VTIAAPATTRDHDSGAPQWTPVLLVWSCLVLLPFGRLAEVPVLLMAAAGLVLLLRDHTALLARPELRTFALVFAAMWLPIALSLVDAVNPRHAGLVTLNHLRFFLSGVFIGWAISSPRARERLLSLSGWLLVFWLVDAGVQMVLGFDLIGRGPVGDRISGLYGSESLKLGTTLGVIAPLLWVFLRHRFSPWVLAAGMLASAYVVMAAASRAGWVSIIVGAGVFALVNRGYVRRLGRRTLTGAIVLAAALPVLAYHSVPSFERRFDQSVSELTGRTQIQASPLGHRGYIWKGAVSMIADNPLNGVGARGFRYAFAEYADPEDPFVAQSPPLLPTHSHQLLLEVTAETGFVGLCGLLLAAGLLARAGWKASAPVRSQIAPYGIALSAAFFPLNTHLAIYSAHWSQIVWWLIAVYCACLRAPDDGAPRQPG